MQGELVADRIDQEQGRLRPVPVAAADARAAAFRSLIGAELDRAYRLAAVILGDRYDAEDAVHDAAEAAWRRWSDLRDQEKFQAWFGKIVVNACRDRLRRRRRRRMVEIPRLVLDKEHPMAPDAADALALRDVLRRAFEALSPEERIVVVLRYEADLTVPRVAELAGIPEGTAKSRLHHALRKLRAAIGEEER
ncbi:MAG: sigma-70 family RNA polymerase sigma factor [Chloroflexota bacterium]|nr:sigma-70 family RNA polymerase sigma factor [Chloroflexota bacterium]